MALKYQPLSKDEIGRAFPKRGQMDLAEYEDMMRSLKPGEAVAVEVNGLTKRQLKRRITSAAKSVLADQRLRYQYDEAGGKLLVLVRPTP
jgi:hypothetical protein